MKKMVIDLLLLENKQLNKDNYLLKLKSPVLLSEILPGQFVNLKINCSQDIFLRRPFSVLDVNYPDQTISLLVKVLGRGSKKLSESLPGTAISAILPLGKSFSLPSIYDRILLIGGGSGVAPLLFLAKMCGIPPKNVHVLIGARSVSDHFNVEEYKMLGNFYFTTEDGSFGEKGYVTNHSVFTDKINEFSKIYTCGPELMMKTIGRAALKNNLFCEVSLENMMACGFGVCLCCVEDTKAGHKCVCTDGPVFNVNELKW